MLSIRIVLVSVLVLLCPACLLAQPQAVEPEDTTSQSNGSLCGTNAVTSPLSCFGLDNVADSNNEEVSIGNQSVEKVSRRRQVEIVIKFLKHRERTIK